MDAITGLLAAQRAEGAFVIRSLMAAPWALRIEDGAPLTLVLVSRGSASLTLDGLPPVHLAAGDAVLVPAPRPYLVGDAPDSPAQARIGPGQTCSKPDGSPLSDFRDLGVRTWGNVPDGAAPEAVLLTATYERSSQVSHHLLSHLPAVVVLPEGDQARAVRPLVDLLATELAGDDPGQGVVLDRLLDLLVVALLRSWFAGTQADPPPWWAANTDPVVGVALRRLHHEPERPWTVAALAHEASVSRAALARRFTELVGEPPMGYLAGWRLDLAADLLRDTDLTLEAVAARVGYGSAFSLSTAFSRRRGTSPSAFRRQSRRAVTV